MNKEQIEKMRNDIPSDLEIDGKDIDTVCEILTEQDYRKEIQGEWKFWKVPSYSVSVTHELICSICGYRVEMLKGRHYNYCPRCGAKMKGE